MKVENQAANELLISARKGERIQEFMDAVSGVIGYRLDNMSKQGHVRGMFAKELIADQFLIELEEIISIFWQGVFEHLDKAKFHGEVVEIKAPGMNKEFRPTKNNPIHFLRYHGRMAVRNHISYLYRRNLEQGCSYCGHKMSARNDKTCPKCTSMMATIYKFSEIDNDNDDFNEETVNNIENKDIEIKINKLLNEFADDELKSGTRAFQILKILVEPSESVSMCGACGLCDAKTFDIDLCTNYNANIGKWLGVNKTMIASKIRRIRTALPKWLQNQNSSEAQHILHIIPNKYKALR